MIPNLSGLPKAGLIALIGLLMIHSSGCLHRAKSSNASPPQTAGATLVVHFTWTATPEDDLGTHRTVILSGREVSVARDSRFVSCFGADTRVTGCQAVGQFSTSTVYTPGPEYDGTETINNAQLGRWELSALGESSGTATASQTCSVNVDTNRLVTVKISLGVDAGCAVQ